MCRQLDLLNPTDYKKQRENKIINVNINIRESGKTKNVLPSLNKTKLLTINQNNTIELELTAKKKKKISIKSFSSKVFHGFVHIY